MALHEPELPFYYYIVCRNKIVKGKIKKNHADISPIVNCQLRAAGVAAPTTRAGT